MENEKSKFNFAATFSLAILLIYSYFSFLGLVYWRQGELLLPSVLTLAFILIVVGCIIVMSISKATRWKNKGLIGQCFFGLIIFVAFVVSAIPFTNFMGVLEKRDDIKKEISSSFIAAEGLDSAYTDYVNNRMENYRASLYEATNSKRIRPSVYNELIGGAAGSTDEEKITNLVSALRGKLIPDSMQVVMDKRLEWLKSSSQMSILNIKLPANIQKISNEVSNWTMNFKDLSSLIFNGERASGFEYQDYNTRIQTVTSFYTNLHKPSFFALLCAVIGFAVMLLPYFMTLESNAGKESNDKPYE